MRLGVFLSSIFIIMATTFRLKRKSFAFPTFGLKNMGNAFGMTKASQAMTGTQRLSEFTKGAAKLGATGAVVATPIAATNFLTGNEVK